MLLLCIIEMRDDKRSIPKNVDKIVKSMDFIEGLLIVYIINDVIKNISENLIMLKNEILTGMVSMDMQKNKNTNFLFFLYLIILDIVYIIMCERKIIHTCCYNEK